MKVYSYPHPRQRARRATWVSRRAAPTGRRTKFEAPPESQSDDDERLHRVRVIYFGCPPPNEVATRRARAAHVLNRRVRVASRRPRAPHAARTFGRPLAGRRMPTPAWAPCAASVRTHPHPLTSAGGVCTRRPYSSLNATSRRRMRSRPRDDGRDHMLIKVRLILPYIS